MKLDVSDKVATLIKRPRIEKGFYAAKLIEAKPRQDKDGNEIEAKYGKQLVLLYQIFSKDAKTPLRIEIKGDNKIESKDLILAKVLYYSYKKEGKYVTAVTPNSGITKTFKAHGWEFNPDAKLDIDEFVGTFIEVGIDDYEAELKDNDGNVTESYKASGIDKVNPFEGEVPGKENAKKAPKLSPDEVTKQVNDLRDLYEAKVLTKEAYDIALDKLGATKTVEKKEKKAAEPEMDAETKKKYDKLKEFFKAGTISEAGYKKALESLGVKE